MANASDTQQQLTLNRVISVANTEGMRYYLLVPGATRKHLGPR